MQPSCHNAFRMMTKVEWDADIKYVMEHMLHHRTSTKNGHIQSTEAGWWVTTNASEVPSLCPEQIQEIHTFSMQHGRTFMPRNTMWTCQGLQPFSADAWFHDDPATTVISSVVTQDEAHDDGQLSITPTLDMPVYIPLRMTLEQGIFHAWVKPDVQLDALIKLWEGAMTVTTIQAAVEALPSALHLHPCNARDLHAATQKIIPCWRQGELVVIAVDPETPFVSQLREPMQTDRIFDLFGAIQEDTKYGVIHSCQDFQLRHMACTDDAASILAAFRSSTITYAYDSASDTWSIRIRTDRIPAAILVNFFTTCVHPDDTIRFGRQVISKMHDEGADIHFMPDARHVPLPPHLVALALAICATRSILEKLPVTHPRQVRFKWYHRTLWKGQLDKDLSRDLLVLIFQNALSPVTHFLQQRLISRGKGIWCDPIFPDDSSSEDFPMSIHLVAELWGGAGPESAKGQMRTQVRNTVAASLLEKGISLEWISNNLDRMIDTIGVASIIPAIGQPPGAARDSRIAQFFEDAKIPLPSLPKKGVYTPQAFRTKQRKKSFVAPSASDFTVNSTYLLNEDGTNVQQISELKGQVTGIYLADQHSATPWLLEGAQLSADELGILVVGSCDIETPLERQIGRAHV